MTGPPHFGRKPRSAKKVARQKHAPPRTTGNTYDLQRRSSHFTEKDLIIKKWESKKGKKLSSRLKDRFLQQAESAFYARRALPRSNSVAGLASRALISLFSELQVHEGLGEKGHSITSRELLHVIWQSNKRILHRRDVVERMRQSLFKARQKKAVPERDYLVLENFLNYWTKLLDSSKRY